MGYRFNGSVGTAARPPDVIDRGTSAPVEHHAPGITDVLKAAGRSSPLIAFGPWGIAAAAAGTGLQLFYAPNLRALAEVRERAAPMVPKAIAEETGFDDLGKLFSGIIHGLLAAMLGLAASTALGGAIGAAVGFFFGVAGAGPGAVVGAKIGFEVGVAVLTWLGVGFLAVHIAGGLGELVSLQVSAVRRGWAAGEMSGARRSAEIDAAAQELAKAAGVLMRLILEGILAYLMRGAPVATARAATGTINQVRAGSSQAVAAETVSSLLAELAKAKRLGGDFAEWVKLNWQKLYDNPKLRRYEQKSTPPPNTGTSGPASTPSQAKQQSTAKAAEKEEPPKTKPPIGATQEIKDLPQYRGLTKTEIEQDLAQRGYSRVPSNDGTGSVWTKPGADGNTAAVRLDDAVVKATPRGFADEVPHLHKEVVSSAEVVNGNYARPAIKFDDLGNVVTGPNSQTAHQVHIPIVWQ